MLEWSLSRWRIFEKDSSIFAYFTNLLDEGFGKTGNFVLTRILFFFILVLWITLVLELIYFSSFSVCIFLTKSSQVSSSILNIYKFLMPLITRLTSFPWYLFPFMRLSEGIWLHRCFSISAVVAFCCSWRYLTTAPGIVR